MYHSITFGDKNTWDDWHIVPTSRPLFVPPTAKVKTIDIPGGDGVIDVSTALTGYPVFNNREGSFEFIVLNEYSQPIETQDEWFEVYSTIMEHLHGKTMRATLEDDPDYFYEGRFEVDSWTSDKNYSKITIKYSVKPYKRYRESSTEDWLWDPFNFITGVITSGTYSKLPVTTAQTKHTIPREYYGNIPLVPTWIVTSSDNRGIECRFVNSTLNIDKTVTLLNGSNIRSEFVMYGPSVDFYVRTLSSGATGTITVDFRYGRL